MNGNSGGGVCNDTNAVTEDIQETTRTIHLKLLSAVRLTICETWPRRSDLSLIIGSSIDPRYDVALDKVDIGAGMNLLY